MTGLEIGLIAGVVLGVLIIISKTAGVSAQLKQLPSGSTRVVTVKANQLGTVQRQYAKAGWQIVQQSTAKSFGTKARVTLTFRKP